MKNLAPTPMMIQLPGQIRDRFAGTERAKGRGADWIAAVSTQNWPELTYLDTGHVVLGDDGLIRLALWSASKIYAPLITMRCITLLTAHAAVMWKIQCLIMANASLATSRPLSGFLLKPVELSEGRMPGGVPSRQMPKEIQEREGETRLALLEALPINNGGEYVRSG
jgi:hypothetical protein